MRYFSWLLVIGCLWSGSVWAQGCGPTNPNCVVPDRPFGDSTNSAANTRFVTSGLGGTDINCKAFGAVGDNIHDDNNDPVTGAINQCIAFAHTVVAGGTVGNQPIRIVLPPGNYLISNPINMTGWGFGAIDNGWAVTFSAYGANIMGPVDAGSGFSTATNLKGHAIFDMMGSSKLRIEGLTILGAGCDPASTPSPSPTGNQPNTAFQMGRLTAAGGGGHKFTDVTVKGCYSLGALYLFGSEENSFINFVSLVSTRSVGSYGLVMDGSNIFNVPTYGTQTNAINVIVSFIGNSFWKGGFYITGANAATGGLAIPLYLSMVADEVIFSGTYLATFGSRCADIVVPTNTANLARNWDLTIHCEGTISNIFTFKGPFSAPILKNFRYREHIATSTIVLGTLTSIFVNGDPGIITSIQMPNVRIEIGEMLPATATLFDTPATYFASGYVSVPLPGNWNVPASWSGTVCTRIPNICDLFPPSSSVAALPTCTAALGGAVRVVNNQFGAPIYNAAPTGGGTLKATVFCDGTGPGWKLN